MIKYTKSILQMVKSFPKLRYHFKTVEVLKGDVNATFAKDFSYEKWALDPPVPENDFDSH